MKKIAPLILMISTSSTALACGDSSDYTAMQIAFAIMLIFIGLAAFIIPASILLFNKAINIRGLFLLLSIVFSLVLVSILLLVIGGHPYIEPLGICILGFALFIPYLLLLIKSINAYKNT